MLLNILYTNRFCKCILHWCDFHRVLHLECGFSFSYYFSADVRIELGAWLFMKLHSYFHFILLLLDISRASLHFRMFNCWSLHLRMFNCWYYDSFDAISLSLFINLSNVHFSIWFYANVFFSAASISMTILGIIMQGSWRYMDNTIVWQWDRQTDRLTGSRRGKRWKHKYQNNCDLC